MDAKQLVLRIRELHSLRDGGHQEKAIRGARMLLDEGDEDLDVFSGVAAVLIDAGSDLGDVVAVQEGIDLLSDLLQREQVTAEPRLESGLKYNLANGYAALYLHFRREQRWDEAYESLEEEKKLLQEVLLQRSDLDRKLVPRALTNYANCLDHVGRTFEAVDVYSDCLRHAPNHGVAMGNCGTAVRWVAPLSGRFLLHNSYAALRLMRGASENRDNIISEAGHPAAVGLANKLAEFEQELETTFDGGVAALEKWSTHRQDHHGAPCTDALMRAARKDRLLLTFNLFPLESEEECRDDLFFSSLATSLEDDGDERFHVLAHSLNQIKEDFAAARYLFYEASLQGERLASLSSCTLFGRTHDYAVFGLRPGMLKISLRVAVDCLDKIAVFLNNYLSLGFDDDRVDFRNIWFEDLNRRKPESQRLGELWRQNYFLRALRDFRTDWFLQIYPAPFRGARNAATHRRLVLYSEMAADYSGPEHWGIYSFEQLTRSALRTVKTAIQTLVCFVATQEERAAAEADGISMPMFFSVEPSIEDLM